MLLSESEPNEPMEMGCELGPNPSNLYMLDAAELKLKRARHPPRSTLSPVTTYEDDQPEEQRKAGMSRNSSSTTY